MLVENKDYVISACFVIPYGCIRSMQFSFGVFILAKHKIHRGQRGKEVYIYIYIYIYIYTENDVRNHEPKVSRLPTLQPRLYTN
jgi:hypothetical protein